MDVLIIYRFHIYLILIELRVTQFVKTNWIMIVLNIDLYIKRLVRYYKMIFMNDFFLLVVTADFFRIFAVLAM